MEYTSLQIAWGSLDYLCSNLENKKSKKGTSTSTADDSLQFIQSLPSEAMFTKVVHLFVYVYGSIDFIYRDEKASHLCCVTKIPDIDISVKPKEKCLYLLEI